MLTTVTTALSPDHKSNCSKSIEQRHSPSIEEHTHHDTYQKDSFYLPVPNSENCINKGISSDILENTKSLAVLNKDWNTGVINLKEEFMNDETSKSLNKTLEEQTTSALECVINSTSQKMTNGMTNNCFQKRRSDVLDLAETITDPLPLEKQKNFFVNKKLISMKYCSRNRFFKRQSHVRYVESGKNCNRYFISQI